MHRFRVLLFGAVALAVVAAFMAPASGALPDPGAQAVGEHAVCGPAAPGTARCHVHVVDTGSKSSPRATTSPVGYVPGQIKTAYGFDPSSTAGSGQTVAIVDAYDSPTIENDLATFSSQFGLPPCTAANGCFTKVNQTGTTAYPRTDSGWALEIALDVEWAHAVAPGAKILLVEASSNSFTNLMAAEDYARLHADYVSNSWGGNEFSGESSYDGHFTGTRGIFVSAGDNGTPAEYPSSSPNVVSVGGTTLQLDASNAITSETGWSSGGGGCSSYESAPGQITGGVNCNGKRATPDLSLVADPSTGVAIYDSTAYYGQTGWFQIGGTSASAPMLAAHAAVLNVAVTPSFIYSTNIKVRDITSGNNGAPCLTGFDLCTGRGSWADNGTTLDPNTGSTGGSPPPPTTTTVGVSKISYARSGNGGKNLQITLTVLAGGSPAVGASVSIHLSSSAGLSANGSGTTGSTGKVTFVSRNAPTATYTTTVTGVTFSGYTWDGVSQPSGYQTTI
jgi:hypothetical protein